MQHGFKGQCLHNSCSTSSRGSACISRCMSWEDIAYKAYSWLWGLEGGLHGLGGGVGKTQSMGKFIFMKIFLIVSSGLHGKTQLVCLTPNAEHKTTKTVHRGFSRPRLYSEPPTLACFCLRPRALFLGCSMPSGAVAPSPPSMRPDKDAHMPTHPPWPVSASGPVHCSLSLLCPQELLPPLHHLWGWGGWRAGGREMLGPVPTGGLHRQHLPAWVHGCTGMWVHGALRGAVWASAWART